MKDSSELFKEFILNKKVAIIGNGEINDNIGETIDNFPLVVRINNFELNEKVGNKVDVCYINNKKLLKNIDSNIKTVLVSKNLNISRADDKLDIYYVSKEKYNSFCENVGIEKDKSLLTGVISAMDFLDNGFEVHLFGFNFFKDGLKYYFNNKEKTTMEHMNTYHCLDKEEKYIIENKSVFLH